MLLRAASARVLTPNSLVAGLRQGSRLRSAIRLNKE